MTDTVIKIKHYHASVDADHLQYLEGENHLLAERLLELEQENAGLEEELAERGDETAALRYDLDIAHKVTRELESERDKLRAEYSTAHASSVYWAERAEELLRTLEDNKKSAVAIQGLVIEPDEAHDREAELFEKLVEAQQECERVVRERDSWRHSSNGYARKRIDVERERDALKLEVSEEKRLAAAAIRKLEHELEEAQEFATRNYEHSYAVDKDGKPKLGSIWKLPSAYSGGTRFLYVGNGQYLVADWDDLGDKATREYPLREWFIDEDRIKDLVPHPDHYGPGARFEVQ